jgi:ribosomal protein S18 acetylase RimI-like enzyme
MTETASTAAVQSTAGPVDAANPRFEIVELEASRRAEAARVLAKAFLDDPAWVAIGPRRGPSRLRLLSRYYNVLVGEALRWGGPNWCAISAGAVAGVALTYADGLRFPPPRATLREAPPFLAAGPGPSLRGAHVDFVMKRAHPRDAHVLLWYIAARPDLQRQGVGLALLETVRAEARQAGLPIYLDTTKPENVGYYQSHGYRNIGEARLPRGARVWFMHLDGRADPDRDPAATEQAVPDPR